MIIRRILLRTALLLVLPAARAESIALAPNQTLADAGYDVSQVVSPSFAGMGIEPSNLFSFTGGDEPNDMTVNLLANLANYTGVPPHLRIGGNTQDYMYYNASLVDFAVVQNPSSRGQGAIASDSLIIGPGYFDALNRLPAGTAITFGLNLAYEGDDWRDRIADMAEAARSRLSNVQLASFEIGNEPDLYLQNGFRSGAWDGPIYTAEWISRAETVFQRVLQPNNMSSNFFEPACTASFIGNTFQITDLAQAGILEPALNGSADGKNYVAAFNQHDYYYYINISQYSLNMDLFQNLQGTRTQFAAWLPQTQQSFDLSTPYVLREMASAGPVGLQGISDTFGAALWQLDFFLYTATLNISSVQIHMTDNSFAAPWQPVDMYGTGPHVWPSYYSFAAMAQIVGAGCSTRIQELPIAQPPAGYENRLGAYNIFRGDDISAVVLINTMISNVSATDKNSVDVSLAFPSRPNASIFVSSLLSPGTDATAGTEWNGISYETPPDFRPLQVGGDSAPQQMSLDANGAATIQLRDASAVVVALDYAVGTGPAAVYDAAACQGLAASRPEPHPDTTAMPTTPAPTSRSPGDSSTTTPPPAPEAAAARPAAAWAATAACLLVVAVVAAVAWQV